MTSPVAGIAYPDDAPSWDAVTHRGKFPEDRSSFGDTWKYTGLLEFSVVSTESIDRVKSRRPFRLSPLRTEDGETVAGRTRLNARRYASSARINIGRDTC